MIVPPLWGSINVFQWLTQGLRPGLWRSVALTGLFSIYWCKYNDFAVHYRRIFGGGLLSPRWAHYRNGVLKWEWNGYNYVWLGCGAWQPHQNSSALWVPLGTTLFHSPGCNEGKARNGTLGTRRQTRIELRRSGTNRASVWFVSLRFVALHSLGKCRPFGAQ